MTAQEFIATVTRQVRFLPDREQIGHELMDHLDDSAADLQEFEGLSKQDAYAQAVENMGDPGEIGRELNRAHNTVGNWTWFVSKVLCIVICVFLGAPLVIGTVVSVSMSVSSMVDYSKANMEFDAPVDTWIDVGETLKLGSKRVTIDWVARLENGDVCVRYHSYSIGRAAWGVSSPEILVDDDMHYNGSGASYGGIITVGWVSREGVDGDAHTLTIGWPAWKDAEKSTVQIELPAREEEAA